MLCELCDLAQVQREWLPSGLILISNTGYWDLNRHLYQVHYAKRFLFNAVQCFTIFVLSLTIKTYLLLKLLMSLYTQTVGASF